MLCYSIIILGYHQALNISVTLPVHNKQPSQQC
jgi:hypothetical protein